MRQNSSEIVKVNRGVVDRRVIVVEAWPDEVASLVAHLARESVEFTFEPLPDGYYRITVKPDQSGNVRRVFALEQLVPDWEPRRSVAVDPGLSAQGPDVDGG